MSPLPDDLLTTREAADHAGLSWHMIRKLQRFGDFPEPDHRVGEHSTAPSLWYRSTIDTWLEQKGAA